MIAAIDMESEAVAFASTENREQKFSFCALGLESYGTAYHQQFGIQLSSLPGVTMELDRVTRAFKRWNAETQLHVDATRQMLIAALKQSSVIHIAAHASEDTIYLADGPFTTTELTALEISEIRCRLIVLSVCDAANVKNTEISLSYELVRRGINLIGSVKPIDDILAKLFFAELYKNWLPKPGAQGIELATAIRVAAEAMPAEAQGQLDELVLYGDPTLQFIFQ